jgi:hypothetical protein
MSVHIVRRNDGLRSFETQLSKAKQRVPRLDARRHLGRLRLREDPLAYQRRVREVWRERAD